MPKFVYVKNIDSFHEEEHTEDMVFIEGTGKIFTHGEYFGGKDPEIATDEEIEKVLLREGFLDGPKVDSVVDTFPDIEISESAQESQTVTGDITILGSNFKYLTKESIRLIIKNGNGDEVSTVEGDLDIQDDTIKILDAKFQYDVVPPQDFEETDETLTLYLECPEFEDVNSESSHTINVIPTDRVDDTVVSGSWDLAFNLLNGGGVTKS